MLQLFKQVIRAKNFSRVSVLVVIAASLLLTGCIGVQTNLALHGQGQWSGVQAITLSSEFVELMESEGTDVGGELTAEAQGLDEWLQQAQSVATDDSLNVTFNEVTGEDGSLSYVVQADGSQYETLNQVLFQGEADISVADVDGQRQITIRYDSSDATQGGATPEEEEMSAEMMEAMGFSIITRISGGEIINHNADRVEGNTAIWETSGLVEITLTEATAFDPATIAPQDTPVGSGPSLATLLGELEQSAGDTATETTTEGSTESSEITTESTTQSSETEIETESTTPSTEATTQDDTVASADPATESADTSADVPASESQALPESGAILSDNSSAASLVLAGMVLISLVGFGTATVWLKKD